MKILFSGGAGFIGSRIAELYQGKAQEIRVLDHLRTGYRRNLDGLKHLFSWQPSPPHRRRELVADARGQPAHLRAAGAGAHEGHRPPRGRRCWP